MRVSWRNALAALCVVTAGVGSASGMTPGEAAAAARTFGSAKNPAVRSDINPTKKASTVPAAPSPRDCMPDQATVEGYYGGGNGNLATPTTPLVAGAPTRTTPECVAIATMQGRAATPSPVTIHPTDPLVVGSRTVTGNPAPTLGSTMGIFVPRPTSSCSPGSVVSGGGSREEKCEIYSTVGGGSCDKPWRLEIKPWWMYTCEKVATTTIEQICTKEEVPTVTWTPSCSAGAEVGYDYRGGESIFVRGKCTLDMSKIDFETYAWGLHGACSGTQTFSLPRTVSSPTVAAWNQPHWFGGCMSVAVVAMPGSGCSGGTCTYNFQYGAPTYGACAPGTVRGDTLGTWDPYGGLVAGPADQCMSTTPAVPDPYTGSFACSPGSTLQYVLATTSPVCAQLAGTPDIAGASMGTLSMTFAEPKNNATVVEHTVSTCDAIEANPSCSPTGVRCISGLNETRNINGLDITKACWKTEFTYECRTAGGPNGCAAAESEPLCAQLGASECLEFATDGVTCKKWKAIYKCTRDMLGSPGLTETGRGYDIANDSLDASACTGLETNPTCTKTSSVCTDTADKTFFGFTFSRSCWNTRDTYSCPSGTTDNCAPLIAEGCVELPAATTCISTLPSGDCGVTSKTYQCGTPATTTPTGSTCDTTPYCINGICYDTTRPGDPDFGLAVAMQEAGREMGAYVDSDTYEVFKGSSSFCRRRLFGLTNCCKNTGGGGGGAGLANGAFYNAFAFGKQFIGSSYVYDTLFMTDMPNMMLSGMESIGIVSSTGASTFNAYGLTIGWGADGLSILSFDPWSFALSVGIQLVLTELTSCPDSDKLTAMKRSQGLCEAVGSFCSTKTLGSCATKKEAFCCFNSTLSKTINIQGKRQLGIGLGTAQNPDCRGLTVAQIQSLDFSRIDMSEFIASITHTTTTSAEVQANVTNRLTSYAPVAPVIGTGPGTPTPPSTPPGTIPPPASDLPEPTIVATWSANPVSAGSAVNLTTTTTGATGVSYDCTGSIVASGTIAPGTSTTPLTTVVGSIGDAICSLTVTNAQFEVTVEKLLTVVGTAPTVSGTFSPASLAPGDSYTLSITSSGADSVTYSCIGTRLTSGVASVGAWTSAAALATASEVGTVSCTATAKDTATGLASSTTFTQTINAVTPTISVSPVATTLAAGSPVVLTVTASQATSVTYTCSGAIPGTGTLSATGGVLSVPTSGANVGTALCVFRATSVTGSTAQANANVSITP